MSFRTIAKFCFLLVIIGFCMPMACDMNGFQLANGGMVDSMGIFAIYASVISSIGGIVIGLLLLLKKRLPVFIDWALVVFCFLCITIMFYITGISQGYLDSFQAGAYVAVTGTVLTLIFQIVSALKKEA